MPEWLLKKDDYKYSKQKDAFIDKSILSMLKILNRFRRQMDYENKKYSINSSIKVVSIFILIIFLSLSKSFAFILVMDSLLLLIISLMKVEQIRHTLKSILAVSIFTFLILLPSILMGNSNALLIIFKVAGSIGAVNIFSCTTKWNDMTKALKLFFIPDMFIFVLDITMKYIIILGQFSLDMLYSLKLRSVGKNHNKNSSLGGIIGIMFIKSKEMADDMYGAMQCRGFNGEYKSYSKFKFSILDYVALIANIGIILLYFYFDRL